MARIAVSLMIVAAVVGGYLVSVRGTGRAGIGGPVLSATPSSDVSVAPTAFTDGTYRLVAASSSMTWEGRKTLIVNYVDRGSIALADGTATVRGGAVVSGSVTVDMTTLSTSVTGKGSGQEAQARHMKSADFFDAVKYPTAVFAFESLAPTGPAGQYTVTGTLTAKGVTQPITFPATLTAEGDMLTMQATATLDRTRWGITYASGNFFKDLGDKVIDDLFSVSFTAVGRLQ